MASIPATDGAGDPAPSGGRNGIAVTGMTLVVVLVILLQLYVHYAGYRRHVAETIRLAETLARVVEDQTQRSLQSILLVLDATQLDLGGRSWLDHDSLRARIRSVPEIRGVYLVGPEGRILDSTLSNDDIGLYVGDQDYIRRLAAPDAPSIAFGSPIDRRHLAGPSVEGLAFFPLAIRLPEEAGYLVAAVNLSFLDLQYRPLLRSSGVAVSLIGFGGTVLMDAERMWRPGLSVANEDPIFRTYLPTVEAATFTRPALLGKEEQLVSFRVTRSFPVVVVLAFSRQALWEAWLGSMLPTLMPTAVAIALVLVALLNLARQLGHIVRQEHDLRLSRDAAEAASKAKSQFLAVMSHEVRTPMNAVLGMASALLEEPLPAAQRQSVQAIHDAGEGLLAVLNDVLDYSRLEAGEISLETATFSPAALLEGALEIIRPVAEAKGLALHAEIGPDIPAAVAGDAGRLRQVLLNVASNAVKFTERGSVTVRLASRIKAGQVHLEWAVTDTGIGIDPDRIDALFQEFVQADSTIHRRFGGSGLGLAICKRIVDCMGGTISVASRPGAGTTVRFGVPLALAEASQLARPAGDDGSEALRCAIARLGRPMRVLMADDNQTNHLVARKLLAAFDIELACVLDGTEAVAAAGRGTYHAILMDMRMPEMDGVTAAREIRAGSGPNALTPIVAFTANAMREDLVACLEAGMDGVVTKPVRKRELVQALTDVLEGAGARREGGAGGRVPPTEAEPVLDAAALRALAADVGAEGVGEIVALFAAEADAQLARLRGLDVRRDLDVIGREAHTLKASAAALGLSRLAALAAALEADAGTGAVDDYAGRLADLESAFRSGAGALPIRRSAA